MSGMGYLLIAIVIEVIGTSLLRASDGFTRIVPTAVALVSWVVALFLFSRALQTITVGAAYAMWSGLGTALLVVIGWVVFQQRLDLGAIAGISLIIGGVIVLEAFSTSELG